ncbi:MAG: response regulator, partial [Chloroflexota bacterium]
PGTTFCFNVQVELKDSAEAYHNRDRENRLRDQFGRVVGLASDQPHYRILVVDDNTQNRELLVKLLEPLGFVLQTAEHGQAAIEIWEQWYPQLIWMDIRMPVLDGYEATRQIKAKIEANQADKNEADDQTNTVIIALTASSFNEEKPAIMAAGCDDFLRKPFLEADIFRLMHEHLGIRYLYREISTPPEMDEATMPISDMLGALPPQLRTQLTEAVDYGNIPAIEAIVEEIELHQPGLSQALRPLVDNFEYDQILALLEDT